MTTFPNSPRLVKGGIVLLDAENAAVQRIIVLQYNPDTLSRSLQPQLAGGEGGDRGEALRIKGPPVETIRLEAEIDATDQLEFPERHAETVQHGIFPQLATLELIVYPSVAQLQRSRGLSASGTLEIAPVEAPLTLFVWSKNRVVPIRITELSVTEEAFDAALNPIRARIGLGMRTLSVADLGFDARGGSLYLAYQQQKEALARLSRSGELGALGIRGLP